MWRLASISVFPPQTDLWFSDGKPVEAIRRGFGESSRLIVDGQGFLDLTVMQVIGKEWIDVNGSILWPQDDLERGCFPFDPSRGHHVPWLALSLSIQGSSFTICVTAICRTHSQKDFSTLWPTALGKLKPLPTISPNDAKFIRNMIAYKYIPYQNIPDSPGKTKDEITALGRRLFPFSPHSFELAMCVYDWTTASFTRMVFLKIFEYTSVGQAPFPIDQSSISEQIWASNWGSYKPTDPDFMKSFMMKPATSLQDVKSQLKDVASKLHDLSDVENRMLSAAIRSLPRTSILSHSRLFSGQMDIYQLGLDHLGIEFLECPLNDGPVDRPLVDEFASAMSSYLSVGKTITTKMVLSFTDSIADAMHYSNGLLLVAECPEYSMVWESAAYVTPLSDNPDKTEYTFMPGSRFEVKSVEEVVVPSGDNREAPEKTVTAITLKPMQPKPSNEWLPTRIQLPDGTREGFPEPLKKDEVARLVESYVSVPRVPEIQEPPRYPARSHFRFGHKTGGRRCVCVDEADT